ncbi:Hint domain-containing protein [Yoonia maritima]|uniref:Hint domain-containing protein n=1 Tax=Yoonia maritima TaxID=1435347 RepID=UPI003735711D
MATTFTVFSLGNLADIDTQEGNNNAENAAALVGLTFGGTNNALLNYAQTFSPGSTGFGGGTNNAYDMDNSPAETFRINGGANQTFDGTAIYNATITYSDGTTAQITAVVFQDTNGNAYLAPEFSPNADQTALEAGPIRSITFDSLNRNTNLTGLAADRQTWDYVTCYLDGTRIHTPSGETNIEDLVVGDVVTTRDNGPQTIRWIGVARVKGTGKLAPVKIARGALGKNLPARDLYVSRQHRMLVNSKIAEKMFGQSEVLVPAIKLVGLPGVEVDERTTEVTYYHLLLDRHEVIYAEGTPSESFLTGPGALAALDEDTLAEMNALFPDVMAEAAKTARQVVQGKRLENFVRRHMSNSKALVETARLA